jgi:Family of unknown function (DUF6492)
VAARVQTQRVADRIDAVLPLTSNDAERARILVRSLDALFEPLATCYVVAPDRDVAEIGRRVSGTPYQVVAESEVIPEIGYFWATANVRRKLRLVGPPIHGWFVQQLVKLAIFERVDTPFYLTLDADVVCVRPTRYDDLVRGGRAVAQSAPPNHPEWNDDAERVLGLPRSGRQFAVTPAVLSRDAVAELAQHLEGRVDPRLRRLASRLPRRAREIAGSWRSFLLRNLPWTEYALYHTFLEQAGRFNAYHVRGSEHAIHGNSVWIEDQFAGWEPGAPDGTNEYRFSVVQSATRIAPELVWAKVERFMTGDEPPGRDDRDERLGAGLESDAAMREAAYASSPHGDRRTAESPAQEGENAAGDA